MNANISIGSCFLSVGALAGLLLWPAHLCAQPTLVSSIPPNMATGVSPSAPVIFTFSEAMNPLLTSAQFMDANAFPPSYLTTIPAWSPDDKVLTCTPVLPFPLGHMIVWTLDGESATGAALSGSPAGMFTPGAADSGCSTNTGPLESFTVAKGAIYAQNSTAAPSLNPDCPFNLVSCLYLVCPHTATNVTLTPPLGNTLTLPFTSIPGHPLVTECGFTTQQSLDDAYPAGPYTFTMKSVSSNQQVTVNFPANLAQPAAPYITNYAAAQAVDPTKPFRLGWAPMAGGSAADCIYVEILPAFQTPAISDPSALNGTATSVVIPAGTLQPNTQYSASVTFYLYLLVTNTAGVLMTYRAAATEFSLQTTSGTGPVLVITNAFRGAGGQFSFEVECSPGLNLVVERRSSLSEPWQTLCMTNPLSSRFGVSEPDIRGTSGAFYRVRTGP